MNMSQEPIEPSAGLFGSRTRTSVLLAVRLLEQTYAGELAAVLELGLYSVQRAIAALEAEGALVTRLVGRTRQVQLDPRYVAGRELAALLWTIGSHDLALQRALAARRRRPRRIGKPTT